MLTGFSPRLLQPFGQSVASRCGLCLSLLSNALCLSSVLCHFLHGKFGSIHICFPNSYLHFSQPNFQLTRQPERGLHNVNPVTFPSQLCLSKVPRETAFESSDSSGAVPGPPSPPPPRWSHDVHLHPGFSSPNPAPFSFSSSPSSKLLKIISFLKTFEFMFVFKVNIYFLYSPHL